MENTSTKVTINAKYEAIIEKMTDFLFEDGTSAIEFLRDRQAKAQKKSSSSGKPTAKQLENEGIKETILKALANYPEGVRVGDFAPEVGQSSSKVTALLTQLVADGKVIRNVDKKVFKYILA